MVSSMPKHEPPLRIPLDFEDTVRGLLNTPPPRTM